MGSQRVGHNLAIKQPTVFKQDLGFVTAVVILSEIRVFKFLGYLHLVLWMGLGVLRSFVFFFFLVFYTLSFYSFLVTFLGPWSCPFPSCTCVLLSGELVVGAEVLDFPGPTSVPGSMPRLQKCALVSIHSLCLFGSQTLPWVCGEFGAGEILSPLPQQKQTFFIGAE